MNDVSLIRYNGELDRNSVKYRDPMEWNAIPKGTLHACRIFKDGRLKNASRHLDQIQLEKEAGLIGFKNPDFLIYF